MGHRFTRRQFSAGVMTAGAVLATRPSIVRAAGANDQIRLGVIGVGNRGDQLLDAFKPHKDARIVALCDVYAPYIEFAKEKIGGDLFTTKDYRELLDRKDVDAVVIATPDHWHAKQFVDACAAGKDVYVEKPLSLVVSEGRKMIEAAKRANRVTQMGVQRRSSKVCAKIAELIQGGAIGKVTFCRCFHITNEWPCGIGNPADCDPPAGLDWDMWLGPARKVPYNPNRCFYRFRWFRDYSGGQLTNFGTHWLDVIQRAIGQDAPAGVFAVGSKGTIKDNREIPDTMEVVWNYPNGTLVSFTQTNANAADGAPRDASIEFRGTEGTILLDGSDSLQLIPEAVRTEEIPALTPRDRQGNARQNRATTRPADKALTVKGRTDTADHTRNFLDCVKTRKPCICPVETGHRSTTTTLLANLAYDRGRHLTWDAEKEQFTNDPEANKLLSYEYRAPWKLE